MQKNNQHYHKPKELQMANCEWQPVAPDPTGMNAMAGLLGKSDLFRDATGLQGTQDMVNNAMKGSRELVENANKNAGDMANLAMQYNLQHEAIKAGLMTKQQAAQNLQKASEKHNQSDGERDAKDYNARMKAIDESSASAENKQKAKDALTSNFANGGKDNKPFWVKTGTGDAVEDWSDIFSNAQQNGVNELNIGKDGDLGVKFDTGTQYKKSPKILEWSCRVTGVPSADNRAPLVVTVPNFTLGLNTDAVNGFFAGIEIKALITNHSEDYIYNLTRVRDTVIFEKINNVWEETYPKEYDMDDDGNDNDEDNTPKKGRNDNECYIYSVDRPGVLHSYFANNATELVFVSNFSEYLDMQKKSGRVTTDEKVFNWHTKLFINKSAMGVWAIDTLKSSIGEGHKPLTYE